MGQANERRHIVSLRWAYTPNDPWSHNLNQCWNIVCWTHSNKFQWNFNWDSYIFIQENPYQNAIWKMAAILSQLQCVEEAWWCCTGAYMLGYHGFNFEPLPGLGPSGTTSQAIRNKIQNYLKKKLFWKCSRHVAVLVGCCICAWSTEWRQQVTRVVINTLRPSDAIWQQRTGSTLAQVMACCLMAPSHYLNQCWLIIFTVLRISCEDNFTRDASIINH